jgi:hypothetical protein
VTAVLGRRGHGDTHFTGMEDAYVFLHKSCSFSIFWHSLSHSATNPVDRI